MTHRDETLQNAPNDPGDFEKRLEAKLEARRKEQEDRSRPAGWAIGLRYGSEFMAGVVVGIGLGMLADWFLDSQPWGMLIGALLGFVAGTLNVVRAAQEVNTAGDDGAESRQDPRT